MRWLGSGGGTWTLTASPARTLWEAALRGAVDRHQPGLEEFLQAGPGPAQGLGQKLVQTGPGLGRSHHLFQGFMAAGVGLQG